MSPEVAAVAGASSALVLLLVVVLVVDHFYGPMPAIRRFRGYLAAAAGVLLAIVTFGLLKRRKAPVEAVEPSKPQYYDDQPERELDKDAANLDLEHAAANREADDANKDLADLGARADARDALLRKLERD